MNKNIGIVIVAVVVVAIGAFVFTNKDAEKSTGNGMLLAPVSNLQEKNVSESSDTETGVIKTPSVVTPTSAGSYEAYSPEKFALAESGKVILFFHATWCPSCRALDSDINKNLSSIPAGVIILKTDYDREIELKKKYGVTSQHTLVQVDAQGNLLKKWTGDSKLTKLLSQIQ